MTGQSPKICVSVYSYNGDIMAGRMTIKDALREIANLDVEGIELVSPMHIPNWPNPRIKDLRGLRKFIESLDMRVVCYSTYVDDQIHYEREATLEEEVDLFTEEIIRADMLGSRVIRVPGGKRHTKEHVTACIPVAEEYDVKMGIEIHAPIPPKLILDEVRAINSKYVGLVPDFSVWMTDAPRGGAGKASLGEFKEYVPYTFHVHAKSHMFDDEGEEPNTPYRELISLLKAGGYAGYISAEFEGWSLVDYDCSEMVKKAVALLRKYV